MKIHTSRSLLSSTLLLSSLVFLPGCAQLEWLKDKLGLNKETYTSSATTEVASDGSQVLATSNGTPLLTAKQFEKEYNNFIDKHPLRDVLRQMDGIEKQIFNGILSQKLLSQWVKDNRIDQTPEYQEQLAQLKVMLDAKHFEAQHQPKEVSDASAQEYYEKNKDAIPEAVISRGGVNALGIEFDKEADAKAFLDKIRGKGAEFSKIAAEAKLDNKVRDFKLVNAQSVGIEPPLRDRILSFQKFATYEIVPVNNKYWVVYASGKEQMKYRPFDQVKSVVKERLAMESGRKAFESGLEDLKRVNKVEDTFDAWYEQKKQKNQKVAQEQALDAVMPDGKDVERLPAAAKVA